MKALLLTGLIAALAAPAAAGVHATAPSDAPTAAVRHDDLNLNGPAGAEVMLSRLHHAARKVCGPAPLTQEIAANQRHRACVRETVDIAVAKLNAPLVTARHNGRDSAVLAAR